VLVGPTLAASVTRSLPPCASVWSHRFSVNNRTRTRTRTRHTEVKYRGSLRPR
jgi:hypothetical protein